MSTSPTSPLLQLEAQTHFLPTHPDRCQTRMLREERTKDTGNVSNSSNHQGHDKECIKSGRREESYEISTSLSQTEYRPGVFMCLILSKSLCGHIRFGFWRLQLCTRCVMD